MTIPGFRTAMYGALTLAVACFLSPFGWGATYRPMPVINMLLTAVYYAAVTIAGVRTIHTWYRTRSSLRWPMVVTSTSLLGMVVYLGLSSLWVQQSSMHDQWVDHKTMILVALIILAIYTVQEVIWRRTESEAQPCNSAYR